MRIFLSHSSRDKPLLREIMQYIPNHVRTWFDDKDLRIGENLYVSIRQAIDTDTDFVLIFISPEAVRSGWVRRELEWALKREREIGRVFILPIVLDKESWSELPEEIQNKRYLLCTDFSVSGIRQFANQLSDELFAWTSRLMESTIKREPEFEREDTINRRQLIKSIAMKISDDQLVCDDDQCLTSERLMFIISSLDFQRKLQLLLLYELMRGRFKVQFTNISLEKYDFLDVVLRTIRGDVWRRIFDFSPLAFEILRKDYGLGDESFLVRDVFLDGIEKLNEEERSNLFSNIEVIGISFTR